MGINENQNSKVAKEIRETKMRRVYVQRLLSTGFGIFVKDILRAFVFSIITTLTTSRTTTVFVIVDALEDSSYLQQ